MSSRSVLFLASSLLALSLATPAPGALARDVPTEPQVAMPTIVFYEAVSPQGGPFGGETARWGYGMGILWSVTGHWAFQLDAAKLGRNESSITPVGLGLVFGLGPSRALRPWLEAGAGYYRVSGERGLLRGLSSAGIPGGVYAPELARSFSSDEWGGYFGAGADWDFARHIGLTAGIRIDNWSGTGLARMRSGLRVRF